MEQQGEKAEQQLAPPAPSWTQQLFSRELGPPQSLPGELRAWSAACRDRDKVAFTVASGRALDYQAVPCTGALLGMHHQPARQAAHRRPRQAPPPRQPAHATLWLLVQPTDRVGVNTGLNVVDAGPTGFGGWHQQGFADLNRRVGVEYSLSRHPASGMSSEFEMAATLPRLLLLPQVTARHRVTIAQATPGVQRSSALSMPLPGVAAVAKVELQERAAGAASSTPPQGATLRLELQGRSKRSRGLAGGAKLQTDLATSFYGGDGSGRDGSNSSSSSSSDSDDEAASSSDRKGEQQQRLPGLRLDCVPGAVRGWADVSGRWQQAWPGRLSSTVAYQASQRRWNLQLSHRLNGCLSAAGTLVCEGPESYAAGPQGAASPAGEITPTNGSGGRGALGERLRQLRSHVRSYAEASQVCKAGVKLTCRLKQPARHLQWESSFDGGAGGSLTHALKCRLGRRPDWQQQRGWCDWSVLARPQQKEVELRLDVFAPL